MSEEMSVIYRQHTEIKVAILVTNFQDLVQKSAIMAKSKNSIKIWIVTYNSSDSPIIPILRVLCYSPIFPILL